MTDPIQEATTGLHTITRLSQQIAELRAEVERITEPTPWCTRAKAAEYLGCSMHWVDDMVATGLLPRKYLANSPRFHRDDLDRLLTSEKVNVRGMRLQQREEQAA